jgi:hypothetical protein
MKKPFAEPVLTEQASLAEVTLQSGGGYDIGANGGSV